MSGFHAAREEFAIKNGAMSVAATKIVAMPALLACHMIPQIKIMVQRNNGGTYATKELMRPVILSCVACL